jgi:hypothetical protein
MLQMLYKYKCWTFMLLCLVAAHTCAIISKEHTASIFRAEVHSAATPKATICIHIAMKVSARTCRLILYKFYTLHQ